MPEGAGDTVILEKLEKMIPEVPNWGQGAWGRSRPWSSPTLSLIGESGWAGGGLGRGGKRTLVG